MFKYFFNKKEDDKDQEVVEPEPDLDLSDCDECEPTEGEDSKSRMQRLMLVIERNLQKEYFDTGTFTKFS